MISFLLFLSSAFACVDMTGTYECPTENSNTEIVDVVTKQVNGVYVYEVNGQEFTADGVAHPIDTGMPGFELTYTLTCDAQSVTSFDVFTADMNGTYRTETTTIYTADTQGNMVQNISSATTAPDGTVTKEQNQIVCQKL